MSELSGDPAVNSDGYARVLGARLRAVRTQQHLSLHAVERNSGGKWKAVVIGSYERGDRAVSVQRLAELAEFYGVAVSELLPPEHNPFADSGAGRSTPLTRIVLNLDKVASLTDSSADLLRRFTASIQRQRGEMPTRVLPVRHDDLHTLALMYDITVEALTDRLLRWQVLAPESVIL
jgi:transcriptional regulator with XRE-family HTH domain